LCQLKISRLYTKTRQQNPLHISETHQQNPFRGLIRDEHLARSCVTEPEGVEVGSIPSSLPALRVRILVVSDRQARSAVRAVMLALPLIRAAIGRQKAGQDRNVTASGTGVVAAAQLPTRDSCPYHSSLGAVSAGLADQFNRVRPVQIGVIVGEVGLYSCDPLSLEVDGFRDQFLFFRYSLLHQQNLRVSRHFAKNAKKRREN